MQRMAFEAAIRRGGVGVIESLAAFAAGSLWARTRRRRRTRVPPRRHISPALAPLLAEASAFAETARTYVRAGIERLADYQDAGIARLSRTACAGRGGGSTAWRRLGRLIAETARELALGMAYEDTVRVAE